MSSKPINYARIDLISVKLVVLCAEIGTLSGAARAAHISVTGASHRLSMFEASLGTKLFQRHPRGLHLTEDGRILVEHGRRLLDSASLMYRSVLRNPAARGAA